MKRVVAAAVLVACGPRTQGPGAGARTGAGTGYAEEETTAAIEKAMNDLAPAAHLCWAAAAVDDYRLAGTVSLLVEVAADGTPAATVQSDTTRDAVLTRCLETIAEGYRWAPPMHGGATLLPFSFTAPHGQNVIDRALIPESDGARVLLDARNSGNGAASLFEVDVAAGAAATASERTEAWIDLATLDALYLPPKAARQPAAGRYLVVSVPGGSEDATRTTGVLPAGPADPGAPKGTAAPLARAYVAERPGVGTVRILFDGAAALSVSVLETEPTAAIPEHVHDGSTELLYVLAGAGTMIVDGVELPITGTSVVQIPAGVKHSFTASAATRAIQIYTPAGPEQRFKQK